MVLSNEEDIAETLQGIGRGLSAEEKDDVLKMMLEVMTVDEHLDPGEKDAILLAGQILGLSQDAVYSQLRSFPPDS